MTQKQHSNLAIALTPTGSLCFDETADDQKISQVTADAIRLLFKGEGQIGLLRLGLTRFDQILPSTLFFWQKFSQRFITEVCHISNDIFINSKIPLPKCDEMQGIILQAPFFKGSEYLTSDVLAALWNGLNKAFEQELSKFSGDVKALLNAYDSSWNLVGRVCFHLAENKNNQETPFAFLATYTSGLSAEQKPKHIPLGRALEEYAGEENRSTLLALLLPVQRASEKSSFIKELTSSGEIFQTSTWNAHQAYDFLKDIPAFESSGIIVRVPNWWNTQKPSRPQVHVSVGEAKSDLLGFDSMLDFNISFALSDGQELSDEEWHAILHAKESLIKVKGQWVEVDPEQLKKVLTHWQKIQQRVRKDGLTFTQGLRMISGIAGTESGNTSFAHDAVAWTQVKAGDGLKKTLRAIRNPEENVEENITIILKKYLHAQLRTYQMHGVSWLWLLYQLKLGGCLADDMGLGKTIQVISLLLLIKHQQKSTKPHILIVPASLLGNWQAEIQRFAPTLTVKFLHSSYDNYHQEISERTLADYDLVVTTYGFLHRLKGLTEIHWDLAILDEAQTIKNPNTKQTLAAKQVKSNVRFVLTGTPIENRLSDLWSLFDFFAPGLLGSLKEFGGYSKKTDDNNAAFYGAVRTLTSPYILRRLKTDKCIINDLPDKTEIPAYCTLSKEQIALYTQAVEELQMRLKSSEGFERSGLIFNYLMRFKQICNHPSQWLGYGDYQESESGKFSRIKEICEEIAAKQEKVLIFTQFQEIISPLAQYVSKIFNREGLILHGGTPIKKRAEMVEAFTQEQGPPFFILSLKAGGTGLNLTSASHVIHFDRWWNPAVENQATDRAYRIGQKKNVMVHKFICQGTIEEKIDMLINSKKALSSEILSDDHAQTVLTQLTDEQLLNIVSLDIHRVFENN